MREPTSDEDRNRLNALSESLFGGPHEIDANEAEGLLRSAGIVPEELTSNVGERLRQRADSYLQAEGTVPVLLQKAVEDLHPVGPWLESEMELATQARNVVRRILQQVKSSPQALSGKLEITFAAAYRGKKDLSARDKEILDCVTNDLKRRIEGHDGDS